MAPRSFLLGKKIHGFSVTGLAVTAVFGLLAYMNVDDSGSRVVLQWLSNSSSISWLIMWWSILLVGLHTHFGHLSTIRYYY
jgi:amino acid permease